MLKVFPHVASQSRAQVCSRFAATRRASGLIASVSFLSLAAAMPAHAMDASDEAASAVEDETANSASQTATGEAIVVTANRREQLIQDVPATIQVVQADTLDKLQINDLTEIANVVPGLKTTKAGGNNLYLRGVGTTSGGYSEAQVAVYIDGIFIPNAAMTIYSFNNIDRIEVLKGPQGTLYGRNATAGLIAVNTRDPETSPRLDATIGYANYDTWDGSFYGSMPLTDTLAANVAVYATKQNDGWGRNLFTGNDSQTNEELGLQAKLQWRPSSGTTITGNYIFNRNERTQGYQVLPGTIAVDGSTYLGRYTTNLREDPMAPGSFHIGSLKIEQDLGFANLLSLTAYQSSKQHYVNPGNTAHLGQPLPGQGVLTSDLEQTSDTWTQEVQLTSNDSDSRLSWVAGLFFFNDVITFQSSVSTTCVANVCAPNFTPYRLNSRAPTQSYSIYADATYSLFDGTDLTLGIRYTDERKQLQGRVVPLAGFPNSAPTLPPSQVVYPGQPINGFPNGIPTSLDFQKITFRAVLEQEITPDINAYASFNRGFKAGAYNATAFNNPPTRPEVLDAYEVGVKAALFDRKLRMNLAYFYYDYTDVQVRSTAPPAVIPIIQNAASQMAQGVDGEISFHPFDGLTLYGSFEVLDAEYRSFPGASCLSLGPNKIVNGVVVGTIIATPCDLAGFDVQYAVPFSSSVGFVYDLQTSFGELSFAGNYHHDDRHTGQADGSIYVPANDTVDASLTWTSPDEHYDVQFFVRNLTKEYNYAITLATGSSFTIVPSAPRTYGVRVGFHF